MLPDSPGDDCLQSDAFLPHLAEQWEQIFDVVSDLICILDMQHRIVRMNKAMNERLGSKKDIYAGKICYKVLCGVEEPPSSCPHVRLLQEGRQYTAEFHDYPLEGDFLVTVLPLRDATGQLVGSVQVARDITETRRAERALQESEARYRLLVEIAQEGISIVDLEENIVFVNQAFARMLGYTRESLVGVNLSKLTDEKDFAKYREEIRHRRQGKVNRYAMTMRHKSGCLRYFSVTASPLVDEQGGFLGMMGVYTDTTDWRRMHGLLRRSEERFTGAFDHAAVGMAIISLVGRLLKVNRAFCSILGYTPEELLARSYQDIVHADDLEATCNSIQQMLDGKLETYQAERRYYHRLGQIVWMLVSVSLVRNEQGKPLHVILQIQDVTDRKLAEETLERLRKAQAEAEKLAATGCMAARVAHEISNPLAGIRNAFYLVRDAVPETHPDHDMVQQIDREIERIASIVRQMYTLYSPQGQKTVDIVVADIIQDVLLVLEPLRRERGVRFQIAPVSSSLTVRMPKGSLHQVVYNLVANAVEASPYGEKVTLDVRLVEDGHSLGTLEISVGNQGEEVPHQFRHRIFEPLFTLKGADGASEGLGLGLSVVKSIVESVGGNIEFESTSGQGTVFRVLLPQGLQPLKG